MKPRIQFTLTLGLALLLSGNAIAQFDSGSAGLTALDVQSNMSIPLPDDGILEYTTINVANGATLTFGHNDDNTPVILLASGDVTIDGTINLNGQHGLGVNEAQAGAPGSEAQPGPGGFPGGIGAIPVFKGGSGIASPGGGPGGGAASLDPSGNGALGRAGNGGSHFSAGGIGPGNAETVAPTYGDLRLLTLSGGSGGAGGGCVITSTTDADGPGGGAGGGAILIASSTAITVNGAINARGGTGSGAAGFGGGGVSGSGGGAGGTIRLMANTISGSGSMNVTGGDGAGAGGNGLVRLEAFSIAGNLASNTDPSPIQSPPTVMVLDPADIPTIRIDTIGGVSVVDPATGDTDSPDVTVPGATSNPVDIGIVTANIPDGAVINLRIVHLDGTITTVQSTPVSSNAATASANLNTGVGVIYASADFNP